METGRNGYWGNYATRLSAFVISFVCGLVIEREEVTLKNDPALLKEYHWGDRRHNRHEDKEDAIASSEP
jgi:hypothetical protein